MRTPPAIASVAQATGPVLGRAGLGREHFRV